MTLDEFRELTKDCAGTVDLAVLLGDGNLDYAIGVWVSTDTDDGKPVIA